MDAAPIGIVAAGSYIPLSCGGGALILRRHHLRNRLLGVAVISDGSFSLDVIIPAGGTVEPLTSERMKDEG